MFVAHATTRAATPLARRSPVVFATRAKSTFFPPNVASLKELGKFESTSASAHPDKLKTLQTFYEKLPKKQDWRTLSYEESKDQLSLVDKYKAKYFEQDSLIPIFHGMIGLIALYYYIQYGQGPHYHPKYEFH